MKMPPEHLEKYLAMRKELFGITAPFFEFLDQHPDWRQISADFINANNLGAALNWWRRFIDTPDDDLLFVAAFTLLDFWCVSDDQTHTRN